jgi:glycosyltransferase involved in cell wall biosynthesis
MSVSILTVTQWSRRDSLAILNDMIAEQTYPDIVEWIIVEGSSTESDRNRNAELIQSMTNPICRIRYIMSARGQPLGALRQAANDAAIGEFRVVMDDDDYYPPTRVSHAIYRLQTSKKKIAGCSAMFMYDYGLRSLYQFRPFGPHHSTSSCMAWKRSYDGRYDLTERVSDEFRFTSGFTQPMVQLDPLHTIVQSSHGANTFAKQGLIDYFLGKTLYSVDAISAIPVTYLTRMTEALNPKAKSPRPPCTVVERCDDESAPFSDATGAGKHQSDLSDPQPV